MSERWLLVFFLPILALDVAAIFDAVTRKDLRLSSKILWVLTIFILPGLGAVIYLLARYKVFETMRRSM
jgi:hypothetical protein